MGPVLVIYIAFASIALFASFLQLILYFIKNDDLMALKMAILSFIIFIRYSVLFFCLPPFDLISDHLTLLRCQLILTQVVFVSMLIVFFHLVRNIRRSIIILQLSIFSFLIILAFSMPDNLLFGNNVTFNLYDLTYSENVSFIVHGFTWWRVLTYTSIILFVFFTILILIKKSDVISFRASIVFFAGFGLMLLAAFYDHQVDLGRIDPIYLLPFAVFIFYMILNFLPYIFLLKEVIDKNLLKQEEEKWRHLINEANVIVVVLNRMGHVDFINPYFYKLTGYQEEEVIGKDWFEFFIPPKEFFSVQSAFIEVLESEFHPDYVSPILTKNKEEKMIRWFNVRTMNLQGKIIGSSSIGVDITNDIQEKEGINKRLKEAESIIATKPPFPPGPC